MKNKTLRNILIAEFLYILSCFWVFSDVNLDAGYKAGIIAVGGAVAFFTAMGTQISEL